MSLVSVAPFYWPGRMGLDISSTPSATSALLDDLSESIGFLLQAPKSGNITKIGWRTAAVTLAPTNGLDVRVEQPNPTGFGSTTLWATDTRQTQTILDTDDNLWFWTTLIAPAVVAERDFLAVVLQFVNWNAGESLSISYATQGNFAGVPYAYTATPTAAKGNALPNIAVEYADGSRPWMGCLPAATTTNISFHINSTPDEVGNRFIMPFSCRVIGLVAHISPPAGATFGVRLYNADDSVIASVAGLDSDFSSGASNNRFLFPSPVVLSAGSLYRATHLPETTSPSGLFYRGVDSAGTLESFPGGTSYHYTARTNAGAWTDTDTRVASLGLLIDMVDDGLQAPPPFRNQQGLTIARR